MSVRHYIKTGKMVKTDDGWVPEQRFVITTPIKAIRLMCIECLGHQPQQVEGCTAHTCPLFPIPDGRCPRLFRRNQATDGRKGSKIDVRQKDGLGYGLRFTVGLFRLSRNDNA